MRFRAFLRYWLPVLIWMGLMFLASTDALGGPKTSRFLYPILNFFVPNISEETLGLIQFILRKIAHVAEYALLGFLLLRARRSMRPDARGKWFWSDAALAWGLATLFALSDEWHQSFTSSRVASVMDIMFDTTGAALACGIYFMFVKHGPQTEWRKVGGSKRGPNETSPS